MFKKKLRRLSAMLMAGVMAVSMMGTAFAAEGESYNPDDAQDATYVLNYANTDVPGYEDYCKPRFYFSPYRTDITVEEDTEWGWCTSTVYNMINTKKIGTSTEAGPYASIMAFCVDAITDGQESHGYRRINLEDSTYFGENAAGRVRAIIMDSLLPLDSNDLSALAAKVNAWAAKNDIAAIENLEANEIVSAAQSTIWTITNNGHLNDDGYAGWNGYDTGCWECRYGLYLDTCPECASEAWYAKNVIYPEIPASASPNAKTNITTLMQYYLALAPMAPQGALVSGASFDTCKVEYVFDEETETYTANITAYITAEGSGDLTLTATSEGKSVQMPVTFGNSKAHKFSISGLTSVESGVKLYIDGTQANGDVYLFDPIGGRAASQTMAGYDESALPVHAEYTVVENERIFRIEKIGKILDKDGNETKRVPLANITFDVYFASSLSDYINGNKQNIDPANPTVAGLTPVAAMTTDEDGVAILNLTKKGLEDGVYAIVERQSSATTGAADPFYVMLPYTNDNGDAWVYEVTAHPKNTLVAGPEISKDITALGNDFDSFGVGEAHTWIITADKPIDLADGIKFEITDVLDTRLDYVGNVKVTVEDEQGMNTVTLDPSTAYIASYDETSHTLTVSLTEAGMDAAASDIGTYIRVYFDTKINATAIMDEVIPNQAILEYTNSTNYTYDETSDKPEVVTGAFKLVKVDGNSKSDVEGVITYANKLAGAEFTLYREATEAEIAAAAVEGATIEVEEIKLEDGSAKKVIAIDSKISDESGSAEWAGLAYGTYYLVETKAPAGYNLLLNPEVVTIGNGTATTPITVENYGGFELPETGGIGTTIYTLMGTMTMAASGMYIFRKKRED